MFVRDQMTAPAITVKSDVPFQDALKLMQDRNFRRLPVVDDKGKLIGIIAERDLLYASPSQATTLSVWEMNYLLSKVDVKKLMTKKVITTTPDTTLEDAANLMVVESVGGLPVVDENNKPIGMITETDIFRTMVEMFAGGQPGLRLTLRVPRGKGVLAKLSQSVADLDGDILTVGSFPIEDPSQDGLVIKVQGVSKEQLIDTLESIDDHVIDAREV